MNVMKRFLITVDCFTSDFKSTFEKTKGLVKEFFENVSQNDFAKCNIMKNLFLMILPLLIIIIYIKN